MSQADLIHVVQPDDITARRKRFGRLLIRGSFALLVVVVGLGTWWFTWDGSEPLATGPFTPTQVGHRECIRGCSFNNGDELDILRSQLISKEMVDL